MPGPQYFFFPFPFLDLRGFVVVVVLLIFFFFFTLKVNQNLIFLKLSL